MRNHRHLKKTENIALGFIILLCMLTTVPPMFYNTDYFDNIYSVILFTMLVYLAVAFPLIAPKMHLIFKCISFMIAGWYFTGLMVELVNFKYPQIILNNPDNPMIYYRFAFGFAVGVISLFTFYKWSRQ